MYVPFGFLPARTLWPRQGAVATPLAAFAAACIAFALALAFMLAMKFAQVFFPPRTVTLNYVLAQSFGALDGIAAFGLYHERMRRLVGPGKGRTREKFRFRLCLYLLTLFVLYLMSLEFALSLDNLLAQQFNRLPDIMITVPGIGRPPTVQAVLLVAGVIAAVPSGMLLALLRRWSVGVASDFP